MNDFEKACNEVERDRSFDTECENAIEWIRDSDRATVTFSQGRFITKIEKLAKKYPDEVQIVARNKGSILAHIPVSYIKINNRSHNLSEEEREMLRERARNNFHAELNRDEND